MNQERFKHLYRMSTVLLCLAMLFTCPFYLFPETFTQSQQECSLMISGIFIVMGLILRRKALLIL